MYEFLSRLAPPASSYLSTTLLCACTRAWSWVALISWYSADRPVECRMEGSHKSAYVWVPRRPTSKVLHDSRWNCALQINLEDTIQRFKKFLCAHRIQSFVSIDKIHFADPGSNRHPQDHLHRSGPFTYAAAVIRHPEGEMSAAPSKYTT